MTAALATDRLGPLPPLLDHDGAIPVRRTVSATGDEVWLVCDYKLGKQVLTDRRFSRALAAAPDAPKVNTANPAPTSVMSKDGADHSRLRRLVHDAFSPRSIALLEPRVSRLVSDLLDRFAASGPPADLVSLFATPLPIQVISELLGIPEADRDRVQELAGVLFDVTASSPFAKARRAFALYEYMSRLLDRKRVSPDGGLLSALVVQHDAGTLSTEELIDLALAMLTAGYETTVGQIALSVLWFLLEPHPAVTPELVEEYIRLTPATPLTFSRVAREDVPLGDVTIRAGDALLVSLLHSNRDAAAFPDPDRLDPAGRATAHLTFGHGSHYCLGASLARLQINVAMRELFQRFPSLRIASTPDAVVWHEGMATRGLAQLLLTW